MIAPTIETRVRLQQPSEEPVVVCRAEDDTEWDRFVLAQPAASGYHLWRWRNVFERVFRHETEYLIARRDAEVVGVLPLVWFRTALFGRFAVSLPFVNYGGVVASDPGAAGALLECAMGSGQRRQASHIELRHVARQFEALPNKQHKVAMTLPLCSSADEMWTRLDRKVRNQVRKAEKSGLVAQAGGRELLGDFYRIFAHNMRDLGTPVYSRGLFDTVLAEFPEATHTFVVRRGDLPIAAAIAYRHGDVVEVPWASSLVAYRSLCPNNLLYWRIIEWAVAQGARVLDFGRSTPDEGTYHFKRQWGAAPQLLFWEYALLRGQTLPDHSPKNPRFAGAIRIWKRLPLAVTNTLGPRIVRTIP